MPVFFVLNIFIVFDNIEDKKNNSGNQENDLEKFDHSRML
jgi:hypothetical protein